MKPVALIFIGAAITVVASCAAIRDFHAANPDFGSSVPPYERIQFASQFATPDETARCEAAGGTVERHGRAGYERCVQSYPDAGKACATGADCLGDCRVPESQFGQVDTGEAAEGICQATDVPFGCYTRIEDGKAEASICVD